MKNLIKKISKLEGKYSLVLTTKSGEVNKNTKSAINNCRIEGNKIYTKQYTGSGNYKNFKDNSGIIETILKRLGYEFTTGNDAPRGGKEGDFIKCSKTAINAIIELSK